MALCKDNEQQELNDIFLTNEKYNELGGDGIILDKPYDNLWDDTTGGYIQLEKLDDNTKHRYIYTFIKNFTNTHNVNDSFYMLKAFIFVRHTDIDVIHKYYTPNKLLPMDNTSLNKSFMIYMVTDIQKLMLSQMSKTQKLNVNPMLYSKKYYKDLIDEIFKERELSITIKDTNTFETLGHKMAFLLYLDDMLSYKCSIVDIGTSTKIDPKQIQREKKDLTKIINSIKKYTTQVNNSK